MEADAPRVRCRRHGVVVAAVPWARHGSRFTRSFEDQVASLAVNTSKTAVAELMRVAWRSVGQILERVAAEQQAKVDLLEGLRRIGIELILPYWDQLLRLAASLRHGWAPASLLLARLQAGSRRNPLAQALQEYGRLIKTNFILAWLADEELRSRIGRQLNKGEQLHALRRAILYADEGHIRHRTPEQQGEQALCLAIGVNAVVAWNTVYTQDAIDQLRAAGELITTSEIEHISPLARKHIHLHGHYPFDLVTRPNGHRPLRTASGDTTQAQPRTPNRV